MRHHTRTTTALATALLLALTAGCTADDDGNDTQQSEQPAGNDDQQQQEQQAPDSEEPSDTAADGDLTLGDTHTWDDGITLTINAATELDPADLGEFSFVPDGETPFTVGVTIVNGSDAPLDLAQIVIGAEGATTGGTIMPMVWDGVTELLDGRLAPGETKEYRAGYTINTDAYGRDIILEGWRSTDLLDDAPTWAATIAPTQ